VNLRQALHHARDIRQTCREIRRVLKPGGVMIATREHVLSRREDLQRFLDSHPLHRFYGGENAYLLSEYESAIRDAGLELRRSMAPLDSPINYFPMTPEQWFAYCTTPVRRLAGEAVARLLFAPDRFPGRFLMPALVAALNRADHTPGRLYSFLAAKPGAAR